MKRFTEQFNKQAKQVKLSTAERRDLRERVSAYMEYHPLPSQRQMSASVKTAANNTIAQEAGWLTSFFAWRNRSLGSLLGGMAMLLVVMVPVLAERAMPGDILYSVKVGFNEEVRSSITRSPYQIIEWETERINRRLAEVQVLAREGRLTDEHEARVAEAVRSHSQSARASIEEIRAEDEDEAAMAEIALAALFDVHMAVLSARDFDDESAVAFSRNFATSTGETASEAEAVQERRSQLLEAIADSRGDIAATHAGERPSYAGLLRRIEVETARAYELLSTVADMAEDDALNSITRRLDDVERKVQSAQAVYESEDAIEARLQLAEALTSTRKVITFLTNIEIRNSIDLDALVPIEYTAAELAEQLHFKRERLQVRYDYVTLVLPEYATSSENGVREQAESALAAIPQQFASSSRAITEEDFATAGTILSEIEQTLDEIVQLVDIPDRLPSDDLDGLAPTTTEAATQETAVSTEQATTTDETATTTEEVATPTATTTDEQATTTPVDTGSEEQEVATSTDEGGDRE